MIFDFVVVPVDKSLTQSDILNIIHESDAFPLIFSGTFKELFCEQREALRKIKFYISMDLGKQENDFYSMKEMIDTAPSVKAEFPKINTSEVAEIVYTSGCTWQSKRSYANTEKYFF